jgi:hypothetical protein
MASPFSGSAGRKSAVAQNELLGIVQGNAVDQLQGGLAGGLKDLAQARAVSDRGYRRSLAALGEGYADARGQLAGIAGMYDPYASGGLAAYGSYNDAVGLSGPEGADRARAAFRAGPGYQWQVDQATDAAARKASALGLTASGNTLAEIAGLGSNLADQEWNDYLDRLDGAARLGYDATGQQAGAARSLADLATGYGTARANLATANAADLAGAFGQAAGLRGQTAGAQADVISGIGQDMSRNLGQGMLAGQNAAQNRLNFGLQLGSLVTGALRSGGMFGRGGAFSPGGAFAVM